MSVGGRRRAQARDHHRPAHGHGDHDDGHHGGVWKIAFADFMTAMMCFFLVMWLINAANEETRAAVASYFNPVKLIDRNSSRKGLEDIGDGPNSAGMTRREPTKSDEQGRRGGQRQRRASQRQERLGQRTTIEGAFRPASLRRSLRGAGRDRHRHRRHAEHQRQGRRRRAGRPGPSTGASGGESYRDPFAPDFWSQQVAATDTAEASAEKSGATAPRTRPRQKPPAERDGRAPTRRRSQQRTGEAGQKPRLPTQPKNRPSREAEARGRRAERRDRQGGRRRSGKELAEAFEPARSSPKACPSSPPTRASRFRSPTSSISACSRSARPCRAARLVLAMEKIGKVLGAQKGTLTISGHTDGRPFKNEGYDNWRLSTARAHSAYYMLVRAGLDERRITEVAGYRRPQAEGRRRTVRRRQPAHRNPAGGRRMSAAGCPRGAGVALARRACRLRARMPKAAAACSRSRWCGRWQLVQDRIAGGDHAALPMQRKLLEMIDARFRATARQRARRTAQSPRAAGLRDERRQSGDGRGGAGAARQRTIRTAASATASSPISRASPKAAQNALAAIDPMAAHAGTRRLSWRWSRDRSLALERAAGGAGAARPGAAARPRARWSRKRRCAARSRCSARSATPKRFTRASAQYVRFYSDRPMPASSPMRSSPASSRFTPTLDLDAIGEIAGMMDAEREKVIYLRIARQAAIDGLTELSAFASARAEGRRTTRARCSIRACRRSPRTRWRMCWRSSPGSTAPVFRKSDQQLLDAASAIAAEMMARPGEVAEDSAAAPATEAPAGGEMAAAPPAVEASHVADGVQPDADPAAAEAPDAPAAAAVAHVAAPAATAKPADNTASPADATDAMMAETRKKLADIDKLLGETSP